ncbi:MAG: RICIN domain-containing protein [Caldilineaceae bacterium]
MNLHAMLRLLIFVPIFGLSIFISGSTLQASQVPYTRIINKHSGMCLTVLPEYKGINGASVIQAPCEYPIKKHQLWYILSIDGRSRYYRIISELDGKCLDVPLEAKDYNGTKLQMWDCYGLGQWNQIWYQNRFEQKSHGYITGYWNWVNKATHKCLDVPLEYYRESGTRIQQWNCYGKGQSNQHWGDLFWPMR